MRATSFVLSFILLVTIAAAQGPHAGLEIFISGDWQGAGDGNWDNLVFEDVDGVQHTFEYNSQVPVLGLTFEPYNGAIFFDGPYAYESLFVDYTLDTISGAPMYHPVAAGGNPGGHTWFHSPMAIRVFRQDAQPFRVVSLDYANWVNSAGMKVGVTHTPSQWDFYPVTQADPNWNTLAFPLMAPQAAGNLGADVLTVNGSTGNADRRVDLAIGQSLTVAVAQPPSNPLPADFIIFGHFGLPQANQALTLPYIFAPFTFLPCDLGGANAITVAATGPFSSCPMQVPAHTTPWSFTLASGIGVPGLYTMQALVEEIPGTLRSCNAIHVRVQ